MGKLIDETLQIAKERFASFGFTEAQSEQLLASGKRDLKKELATLKERMASEPVDIEALNQSLHALKGLLYNMGNNKAGDVMVELRNNTDEASLLLRIREIIQDEEKSNL